MSLKAAFFARQKHRDQKRKYTGDPYIFHPARVAARASILSYTNEVLVNACWLHDTIEDCDVTFDEIRNNFGQDVAALVHEVTNPSKGSTQDRATRKLMDRMHLKHASRLAKVIKLIDRTDNLKEIPRASSFAKTYYDESILLLENCLAGIDSELEQEYLKALNGLAGL